MRSAYLLAKITPHTGTYEVQGPKTGSGGNQDGMGKSATRPGRPSGFVFSVEAAGYATAPLPRGLSDLMFCKYGHNTARDEAKLTGLVRLVVQDWAIKRKWDLRRMRDDTIDNLVKVAVLEALSSGACSQCLGTKSFMQDNVFTECQACDGTGYSRISERACAYLIGIHHETFRRSWKRRYNEILSMLTDWENDASWIIYDRLNDRDEV